MLHLLTLQWILELDKSLKFNLYRLHNIPLVHPILKKSFEYSIQEEYLAMRSDSQYISFLLSNDIMTSVKCQMANFATLIPLYIQQIPQILVAMLFFFKTRKINKFCILSVINQTQDEAFNINDNFLAKAIHNLFTI